MQTVPFGSLGSVSRLTLGGGGIGQYWGETSRAEAIATLHMAVDSGIDLIDAAPVYKNCQQLIGEAFGGRPPAGVRFTTKTVLGAPPAERVHPILRDSLVASLAEMRIEQAAIFFLHTEICDDNHDYSGVPGDPAEFATPWSLLNEAVVPAFERLVADGLAASWGITAIARAPAILRLLDSAKKPAAIQAIANLLDSDGGIARGSEANRHREIIAAAARNGAGVMGIRVVQAGALTASLDREVPDDDPTKSDFAKAAPFRALCRAWGQDPAFVAHRYALSMPGVDTVVLGVKNRAELKQALDAEEQGPLSEPEIAAIDNLGLRAV